MVLHCGFITADHQLSLPVSYNDRRRALKEILFGVLAKNDIFTLTQLMSTAVSITLPSLSWMLSCVVINFPGRFMPNMSSEQRELIAFLTIHFSPWNAISLPQLMSLVRAGTGETRPESQNCEWGTYTVRQSWGKRHPSYVFLPLKFLFFKKLRSVQITWTDVCIRLDSLFCPTQAFSDITWRLI